MALRPDHAHSSDFTSVTSHRQMFFALSSIDILIGFSVLQYVSSKHGRAMKFYEKTGEISGNMESGSNDYNKKYEKNISELLDRLIASHDRRIRPNYGGPPIEVNITAHITTISSITEVSMDYTLDLYLRQIWKDPRLAWESDVQSSLTIGVDMVKSIWTPDTFFPNEKKSFFHEATSHNSFLRIDNQGNVLRSVRLTFPLDIQECSLEIESYGYSTRDIIYHWNGRRAVIIDENVYLAHFSIADHHYVERIISLSTGNYSRLSAYFTFKRNIGFYLIQIYLPSSLIVVISWVSFWLNREAVQARVAIGVTTVLTMTTLMTSTNATLPKVSYVKSLDIYLGICFFIVFASLLEYAAIGYLMKQKRLKASPVQYHETSDGVLEREDAWRDVENGRGKRVQIKIEPQMDQTIPLLSVVSSISYTSKPAWMSIRPSQVDLFSRFAFPTFFLLFHLVYWGFYLNI
ncbi:unnamed protein product [Angiostrongylus costaricensis]|uniref:Gamma-aminobutyric acid receptor subunit beta n=1 Tax=Angiostrongylus costaricensis TaxID=334426 RepID=A0A158PKG5_ANGCS|nr:unnamed protein product [Angiostrongylus costaricensis]